MLWVSVVVASSEGRLPQEITAVPQMQRGRTRVNDQFYEQSYVYLVSVLMGKFLLFSCTTTVDRTVKGVTVLNFTAMGATNRSAY